MGTAHYYRLSELLNSSVGTVFFHTYLNAEENPEEKKNSPKRFNQYLSVVYSGLDRFGNAGRWETVFDAGTSPTPAPLEDAGRLQEKMERVVDAFNKRIGGKGVGILPDQLREPKTILRGYVGDDVFVKGVLDMEMMPKKEKSDVKEADNDRGREQPDGEGDPCVPVDSEEGPEESEDDELQDGGADGEPAPHRHPDAPRLSREQSAELTLIRNRRQSAGIPPETSTQLQGTPGGSAKK